MTKGARRGKNSNENDGDGDAQSNQKIGPASINHIKGQVREWTGLILNRCDHLGNYVNTLEKLNERLEARTDRSLALSEVIICVL